MVVSTNMPKLRSENPLEAIALKEEERNALTTFLESLYQSLGGNLVKVILFGSQARGQAKRGSDIDLVIIVRKRNMETIRKVYKFASRADLRWGVDVSPKIYSLEEYQEQQKIGAPFVKEIEKEGIALT